MFPNAAKNREKQKEQILEIMKENPVDGEELVDFLYGIVKPTGLIWLIVGGALSAFFMKYLLLVRTTKRIIVVNLNMREQFVSFNTYSLSEVKLIKYSKGLINHEIQLLLPEDKKLRVTFTKLYGFPEIAEKIVQGLTQA